MTGILPRILTTAALLAILTAAGPPGPITMPSNGDISAFHSYAARIPVCQTAIRIDDFSANPRVVSAATQARRVHAYAVCYRDLQRAGASRRVLNVDHFLLGRACMLYALENVSAAGPDDCS